MAEAKKPTPLYTYRVMVRMNDNALLICGDYTGRDVDEAIDKAAEANPPDIGKDSLFIGVLASKWTEARIAARQRTELVRVDAPAEDGHAPASDDVAVEPEPEIAEAVAREFAEPGEPVLPGEGGGEQAA